MSFRQTGRTAIKKRKINKKEINNYQVITEKDGSGQVAPEPSGLFG